jgi:hypothetical protein
MAHTLHGTTAAKIYLINNFEKRISSKNLNQKTKSVSRNKLFYKKNLIIFFTFLVKPTDKKSKTGKLKYIFFK